MKLTVYHDGQYFVGMIEREENGRLYAVRHIFGTEPSDEEVLLFVNDTLLPYFDCFAKCGVEIKQQKRPKNVKRMIRQAARELKTSKFTKAQEAIQLSYEVHKQEKQVQSKEMREVEKRKKRALKVQKAKQKRRGH
ncbi:YjdF family protein [Bacillus sp. CGMCC 1.60114]|uniref:YjdF family protein n=1 Tax=unclassified Bacillus (in: firmicutes) TaxID=185979 RepID=UPI00363A3056